LGAAAAPRDSDRMNRKAREEWVRGIRMTYLVV
jgi:hypothetical protein